MPGGIAHRIGRVHKSVDPNVLRQGNHTDPRDRRPPDLVLFRPRRRETVADARNFAEIHPPFGAAGAIVSPSPIPSSAAAKKEARAFRALAGWRGIRTFAVCVSAASLIRRNGKARRRLFWWIRRLFEGERDMWDDSRGFSETLLVVWSYMGCSMLKEGGFVFFFKWKLSQLQFGKT